MSLPIVDDPAPDTPDDTSDGRASETAYERRGVVNPRIIDLITCDRETGHVVLKIFEPRPWGAVTRQLHQLEDKLNAYFGYVLDGFLAEQYPQYRDRPVRIHLECVAEPGEGELPFLAAATRFAEAHGLGFGVEVVKDTSRWRAPWEGTEAEGGKAVAASGNDV